MSRGIQIEYIKVKWSRENMELKIAKKTRYTKQDLIEEIHQFQKENGRPPTQRDFENNSEYPSYITYYRKFGSFSMALIAAGFGPNKDGRKQIYTRQNLIEEMQRFEKENRRRPTEKDFSNNPNYPNRQTIINQFGSWNAAKILSGFNIDDTKTRGRYGEIQTINEFKVEGAIDLSGQDRNSICDGICPKGEKFDTKSASITRLSGYGSFGWGFGARKSQLMEVNYLFLRAYEDKDFTKKPLHIWRVPIEFMKGRTLIFIHKDNVGMHNVSNMSQYEILI